MSQKAGIGDPTSKSLGVTVFDYNGDGWPDIFVANDTQPNKLYRNNKNGTFTEEGMAAGVAFGEDGVARGAMGADAAITTAPGAPHLLVGNFSNQMLGLYHNEGNGLFVDEAPSSTVGRASLLTLTFGVFFFDYDLDGYPDIFAANGHIEEEIGRVQPKVQYKEAAAAVSQSGPAAIRERERRHGAGIQPRRSWRAARRTPISTATAISTCSSPPTTAPRICSATTAATATTGCRVRLVGTKSNRDGIGAVVRIESASGKQWNAVHSGSQLLLAERSRADVRTGQGCGGHDARYRVAQRDETAAGQHCGRSVRHHRRRQRHRREVGTAAAESVTSRPCPPMITTSLRIGTSKARSSRLLAFWTIHWICRDGGRMCIWRSGKLNQPKTAAAR